MSNRQHVQDRSDVAFFRALIEAAAVDNDGRGERALAVRHVDIEQKRFAVGT